MQVLIYIAIVIVSAFVASALAPKPPKPRPAALSDFDVPTAEDGRPLPMVFGSPTVTGSNVIWYGDLSSSPIRTKGGKK